MNEWHCDFSSYKCAKCACVCLALLKIWQTGQPPHKTSQRYYKGYTITLSWEKSARDGPLETSGSEARTDGKRQKGRGCVSGEMSAVQPPQAVRLSQISKLVANSVHAQHLFPNSTSSIRAVMKKSCIEDAWVSKERSKVCPNIN